jgi:hypothetical protein
MSDKRMGDTMASKRDYESTARVLRAVGLTTSDWDTLGAVAVGMANIYATDNPRFDRVRFFEAAQVTDHVGRWEVSQ